MRRLAARLAGAALLFAAGAAALSPAPSHAASPAPRAPVVVLLFDEWNGTSLATPGGRLDARRFPHLARLGRTATWYPNAATTADLTVHAVPALLSGTTSARGPGAAGVFTLLRRSHRGVRYEPFLSADPCSWCGPALPAARTLSGAPVEARDVVGRTARRVLGAMRGLRSDRGRPPLWFAHAILPHAPYRYLPSGRFAPAPEIADFQGQDGRGLWRAEAEPIAVQRRRFLLQGGFADRLVGALRRRLTRAGLWDRALVVVAADHGSSFSPGTPRRHAEAASFADIASVPLLVKLPRQRRGRVDAGSAHLTDVLATIADVTGRRPSWRLTGRTLRAPRPARAVVLRRAAGEAPLVRSFAAFREERAAAVAAWNTAFRGRARIAEWTGPARALRGRRTAGLRPRDPGARGPSARLDLPGAWRAVHVRGGIAPVVLSATLRGVAPGATLVASLNGRIVAAGRAFTQGDVVRSMLFLPERRLRRGANRVQVLLVGPDGGLTRLARSR